MWKRRSPNELTPREGEILNFVRLGLTNEEIAQRLGITVAGVKYHVSQILSKLGVATREEAAAWEPPQERAWYLKVAWLGAAGVVSAAALAGIVVALSTGGKENTIESRVVPEGALARVATPGAIGGISSSANGEPSRTPTPASTSGPTPLPSPVLVGPDTVVVAELPTPPPAPTLTETRAITPTETATPGPCETHCSGIEGRAVMGPALPRCDMLPPQQECYPGYQATIAIWNADRTERVLEFTTDEQGYFRVPLSPGEYYIDPQGSAYIPDLVTVPPDGFRQLEIVYDSGIQ